MALPTCPRCQSNAHVLMVQTAAGDSAIPAELRSAIAAPPPPVRPPGQIGCMSLIITTVLALLISMAAALVAEYTALLSGIPRTVEESAAGLRQDSAFSGIVVFMFGFVAIFSVFVYRHFRSSTIFSLTAERWRRARK
ncbi:MAG TPA: hypothetical protein PKC19_23920, partial [Roseiflexaceae bacterium]|nr:hypothetical protein [Roseiflexaceae bacterium]